MHLQQREKREHVPSFGYSMKLGFLVFFSCGVLPAPVRWKGGWEGLDLEAGVDLVMVLCDRLTGGVTNDIKVMLNTVEAFSGMTQAFAQVVTSVNLYLI